MLGVSLVSFSFVTIIILQHHCLHTKELDISDSSYLEYNKTQVTWGTASSTCEQNGGNLLRFNIDGTLANRMAMVKRNLSFHHGNEAWVGHYQTYDVLMPKTYISLNTTYQQCAAITIASIKALNPTTFMFNFELNAADCTTKYRTICICQANGSNTTIYKTTTSSNWTMANHTCKNRKPTCSLWTPKYHALSMAVGGTFGKGNITIADASYFPLLDTFWINVVLNESSREEPVTRNILRCGYINATTPRINYRNCDALKGFICAYNKTKDINETQHDRQTSSNDEPKVGVYAGIAVGTLVVICVVIGAIIWWKRANNIKIHENDTSDSSSDIGTVTTRVKKENSDSTVENNDDNRMTLYAKIDPLDVKHMADDKSKPSFTKSVRIHDDTARSSNSADPYAVVSLNKSNASTSHVGNDITVTGYLAMDGCRDESSDTSYDRLSSVKRRDKTEVFEASENIYDSALHEDVDSVYDSTLQRHTSKRALIGDYDHVSIESSMMHREICNSIGVDSENSVFNAKVTYQNPNYDRVIIK